MRKRSATIVGFGVASAAAALMLALVSLISEMHEHQIVLSAAPLFFASSFLVFYPYSLICTVLFGVPMYLIVRWMRLVTWWSAIVSGALVGLVIAVVFRPANQPYVDELLRFVPSAAVAALAFWLIWRQGRDLKAGATT